MESVTCNFCGSTQAEVVFTGHDRLHDTEGMYSLLRCVNCGLLYLNPRPKRQEIGEYYPDEYVAYKPTMLHEWFPLAGRWLRKRAMDRRCRHVLRFKSCGRLLDVGCATGLFLEQMRHNPQWQLFGLEPHVGAAACASERSAVEVHAGMLEGAHYPDEHFDVVTLWDVFEHLHDPIGALREFNRILASDGLLIVSIPNVHSLEARFFGPYWAGYDIPRHLYGYPVPTLRRTLDRAGFEVADVTCFEGGYFIFALSLWQLVRARVPNRLVRGLCHRILFLQGMRVLFWPWTRLVDSLGMGPVITLSALKRYHQAEGATL